VDAPEIVVHEVQRDSVEVILQFLAEGIRQPGEPSHLHPHRQILALDK